MMRHVIHDWEDGEAIAILKACRRAMRAPARLLLSSAHAGATERDADHQVQRPEYALVLPGGRERTRDEYARCSSSPAFELTHVAPAGTGNVIEARLR